MIETVTLTRISATDKKADGTKLTNKFGDYFRVGIQVQERTDTNGDPVWLNGFSKNRPDWNVGDKLEIEIGEEEYNGEKRLKFRLPKKGDRVSAELEARVKKLEDSVFGTAKKDEVKTEDVDDSF